MAQDKAYENVDRAVAFINAFSPAELAYKLTQPFKTEKEKVRAIFRSEISVGIKPPITFQVHVFLKTKSGFLISTPELLAVRFVIFF